MRIFLFCAIVVFIWSCNKNIHSYNPQKKYAPVQLQKDFSIFKETLERYHPSLYWYSNKTTIDSAFHHAGLLIEDSLTEPQFGRILASVTAQVRCGHTSVRPSKRYTKYMDTLKTFKAFPFIVKLCGDTVVYLASLKGKDSVLTRGTVITSINGLSTKSIIDTLFRFLPTDGYNTTHKYQMLSNGTYFGSLYTSIYGISNQYAIKYLDSNYRQQSITIPVYSRLPVKKSKLADSATHLPKAPKPHLTKTQLREQKRQSLRNLTIDTLLNTAILTVNSFSRGVGLRSFLKKSFRTIKEKKMNHLIIDVRNNGGGLVSLSNALTRYMADHGFKLADSLYALRHITYNKKYVQQSFFTNLFLSFLSYKKKDGYRHMRFYEKQYFKPNKKDHYTGKVYVLTGGNSFSATTLFAHAIQYQPNVTLVGEETGGGSYGNTAWIIPWVTLPVTGVKFRLPLFRLVMKTSAPKTGHGIIPGVFATYTVADIKKGVDVKMEKTKELIKDDAVKK